MASTLTIASCSVETNQITITFSDAVDKTSARGGTSATDPGNYAVFDPAAGLTTPTVLSNVGANITVGAHDSDQTVTFNFDKDIFKSGDFVLIEVSSIALASNPGTSALIDDPVSISRQVPPKDSTAARTTKDVEDAIAYPILTEEIGYRPSPVGIPAAGAGSAPSSGQSNLGMVALKAVSDVLGWKPNPADPKGFVGALTQSFTLKDVEGHVESTWTPRTYAVQSDLGGGISGAQASLYMRAKDALDKSLPLLDGLYPLDPEADPEYVKALREMARSQMTEIVKELGTVGLPSILRIDTYFNILLGQSGQPGETIQFEPDLVKGTLGQLRDTYGIFFLNNKLSNSVEDEQDITNFRVISDYMTSLLQSWISNRDFFRLGGSNPAFFGTQLVLISRQFNVITETVNELRFALDSVFIGPSERQTLLLEFPDGTAPMFLEDVLNEIDSFTTDEGPRLLRDGGRISVGNNILPVVQSLQNLVQQTHNPTNIDELPDGFKTARVRNAIDDLADQLASLITLIRQITQEVPPSENTFTIDSIIAADTGNNTGVVSIFGSGFEAGATVEIHSAVAVVASPGGTQIYTQFYSPQRIDVVVNDANVWPQLQSGSHTITVNNPDGNSVEVTVPHGLTPGVEGIVITEARFTRASKPFPSKKASPSVRRRPFEITLDGKPVGGGSGTSSVPPGPPTLVPRPAVDQQLAALQSKHDEIQRKLDAIQRNHNALSTKVDEAQKNTQAALSSKFAEVQKNHETVLQELKGWGAKLTERFESSKGKKT